MYLTFQLTKELKKSATNFNSISQCDIVNKLNILCYYFKIVNASVYTDFELQFNSSAVYVIEFKFSSVHS